MKKRSIAIILAFSIFLFSAAPFAQAQAPEIAIEAKKIDYPLPYAGILPDHPLYFIKLFRDGVLTFMTRDNIAKAELHLLFSDKFAQMARELSEKGKWELAAKTIQKGEEDFSKIPTLLEESKKQGVAAEDEFVLKLKLSNAKHKEVIEALLKNAPQGQRTRFQEALKMTDQIQKELASL